MPSDGVAREWMHFAETFGISRIGHPSNAAGSVGSEQAPIVTCVEDELGGVATVEAACPGRRRSSRGVRETIRVWTSGSPRR